MAFTEIFGLLLILCSCSFLGFYKSSALVRRTKKLSHICLSLERLLSLICFTSGELDTLLAEAFKGEVIKSYDFSIDKNGLLPQDVDLLEKLLTDLGMGDLQSESKRLSLYKSLFEKQLQSAEEAAKRLFKLYNSLGILVGLAICIFIV